MKMLSLLATSALCVAGCSANLPVPKDEAFRGSMNPAFFNSAAAPAVNSEEYSPVIRETILQAVRKSLVQGGHYPKRAIDSSELLQLVNTPPNSLTANAKWSYRAVVRINLDHTSLDVQFMVFERNDEFIVRKISG